MTRILYSIFGLKVRSRRVVIFRSFLLTPGLLCANTNTISRNHNGSLFIMYGRDSFSINQSCRSFRENTWPTISLFFSAYDGPLFTTTTAEEAGKMIPIKSGRHLRLRYSIDTWSKRIHSQLLNMTVVFEAQVVTARDKECWGCKCGT